MKLKDLGYALKGATGTVCTQCHKAPSKTLSFDSVHNKRVSDKKYDCSFCHSPGPNAGWLPAVNLPFLLPPGVDGSPPSTPLLSLTLHFFGRVFPAAGMAARVTGEGFFRGRAEGSQALNPLFSGSRGRSPENEVFFSLYDP